MFVCLFYACLGNTFYFAILAIELRSSDILICYFHNFFFHYYYHTLVEWFNLLFSLSQCNKFSWFMHYWNSGKHYLITFFLIKLLNQVTSFVIMYFPTFQRLFASSLINTCSFSEIFGSYWFQMIDSMLFNCLAGISTYLFLSISFFLKFKKSSNCLIWYKKCDKLGNKCNRWTYCC